MFAFGNISSNFSQKQTRPARVVLLHPASAARPLLSSRALVFDRAMPLLSTSVNVDASYEEPKNFDSQRKRSSLQTEVDDVGRMEGGGSWIQNFEITPRMWNRMRAFFFFVFIGSALYSILTSPLIKGSNDEPKTDPDGPTDVLAPDSTFPCEHGDC